MKLDPLSVVYSNITFKFWKYRLDISGRMYEWYAAFCSISIAILLLFPGDISRFGTIKLFHEMGYSENIIGTVFMLVGLGRMFALAVNGHIGVVGPRIRAVGAMLGAMLWGQLAISLLYEALTVGRVSIGIVVFWNMAFFDFLAAYRAGLDVKRDW